MASGDDAAATTAALAPHVDEVSGAVTAVDVTERVGGAPDEVSVEQREHYADEIFDVVADGLANVDVELEAEYRRGTDVAETIIDASNDLSVSAIVLTPRGTSRWIELLAGDVTTSLVNESDRPAVVLPDSTEADDDR